MRLTVIGFWGGSPRRGGACSGYLLEEDGQALLLDCGSGVAAAVQQVRPLEDIDHVILSHHHFDHASDAGVLMNARYVHRLLGKTDRDLVFYGPEQGEALAGLAWEGSSRACAVGEGSHIEVGPFSVDFCQTSHPVPCLAARVTCADGSVLGYTADAALTPGLASFVSGVDVLLSECSLYRGFDGSKMGHMSCDDVAKLAEVAHPGTLVLTHLPIYGDVGELVSCVREALGPGACGRVLDARDICLRPFDVGGGKAAAGKAGGSWANQ